MVNPRRSSYGNIIISNHQNPENQSISLFSILNLLKKPQVFPLLLTFFIFITWVSLRFQHSSSIPLNSQKWSREFDLKANLVRFSSSYLSKDNRGWLLNPISAALDAHISGGAVSCASVHVGEIRPGGMRGNHRHYTCNETFIFWGARLKFRMHLISPQNAVVVTFKTLITRLSFGVVVDILIYVSAFEVVSMALTFGLGYAEVIIAEDEVAVAGSPIGTAHAMVNVDPVRTAFLLGCQDGIANYNSSGTAFNIWNDL
ncbi:hypothetical protein KSS87_013412 [Heliosperma pusillum]|nr:hypothetical protein KSS87_013412 [Heliosperma pusillum]